MTFYDWIKKETGMTWLELQMQGTTDVQRYRLYEAYEEYCISNCIQPNFNFKGDN